MNDNWRGAMDDKDDNGTALLIKRLLAEVQSVSEENFGKWYENKRKVFHTGIRKPPTREEFLKYLNYALNFQYGENTDRPCN